MQEQHGAVIRGGGKIGKCDDPPAGSGHLQQEAGDGRGEVRARGARLQDRPLRGGGEGEQILVATRYLNLMCSWFCLDISVFSDIIF